MSEGNGADVKACLGLLLMRRWLLCPLAFPLPSYLRALLASKPLLLHSARTVCTCYCFPWFGGASRLRG